MPEHLFAMGLRSHFIEPQSCSVSPTAYQFACRACRKVSDIRPHNVDNQSHLRYMCEMLESGVMGVAPEGPKATATCWLVLDRLIYLVELKRTINVAD